MRFTSGIDGERNQGYRLSHQRELFDGERTSAIVTHNRHGRISEGSPIPMSGASSA